ncbi:hypothetical protein RNJ44_02375 [Nakaseomyces bracarensis]|uniref:Uncharacterized protein n=1 Tax=Nakaseomyces bracarensis TaxID=273131 RepID=A0ABR4NNA3_9SACH
MPGKIISVPFLSQNEDMDRYLIDYQRNKNNYKGKLRASNSMSVQQRPDGNKNIQSQTSVDNMNLYKNRGMNNNSNYSSGANSNINIGNLNRNNPSANFGHNLKNGGLVPSQNSNNQQKGRFAQQQTNQPIAAAQLKQVYSQFYYSLNNKIDNSIPLSNIKNGPPGSFQNDIGNGFQAFGSGGVSQNEYTELFNSFQNNPSSSAPNAVLNQINSKYDYSSNDGINGHHQSMTQKSTSTYLDDYLMPKSDYDTNGNVNDISLELSKDISNLSLGVDSNVGFSSFPFTDEQRPLVSSSLAFDLEGKSTLNSNMGQNSESPFNMQSTRGSLVNSMSPMQGSSSINWENNDLPSSSTSSNRLGIWNNGMSVWS